MTKFAVRQALTRGEDLKQSFKPIPTANNPCNYLSKNLLVYPIAKIGARSGDIYKAFIGVH